MVMNGFRSRVRSFFFGKRKDDTPVILTEWGPLNEAARKQAEVNMCADPEIKKRVEAHFIKQAGGRIAEGLITCRKQFPGAYKDN